MVPTDDDDVPIAIAGAVPGLLHGLEPVDAPLDFGEGAEVGQVPSMDEKVAWWEASGGDLGVGVGDADAADSGAESGGGRWFVCRSTEVQQEVVQKSE